MLGDLVEAFFFFDLVNFFYILRLIGGYIVDFYYFLKLFSHSNE